MSASKAVESNHALSIQPGQRQVALLYARSLLSAGDKTGVAADLVEELVSLVTEVLQVFPRFQVLLASPYVKHADKEQMIGRVLGNRCSLLLVNFLKVLSKNARLGALPSIAAAAQQMLDEREGRIRVEVRSALPIQGDLAEDISGRIKEMFRREPVLENVVDPSMIGGVVFRVGDTVYDGSISSRLRNLREEMIHRSVHEIQSRRDRFCNPEGN